MCKNFEQLIEWQLQENHPKSWFRAWFNMGLINYIEGGRRMLPCEAGSANFFIDPFGEVYPCNGLEEKYWQKSMGNIHETPDSWISGRAAGRRKSAPWSGNARKLLDGRYGQSCNAQIHEIPVEVGAQKQAPQPAGKTGQYGQEVVRCRPRPDARRFAGKILTKS